MSKVRDQTGLRRQPQDYRVKNEHKIPKKKWGSWTSVAKQVFNKTYETMMLSPSMFQHASALPIEKEQWKVTAWNAAWIAADICSRGERAIIKDLTERAKS